MSANIDALGRLCQCELAAAISDDAIDGRWRKRQALLIAILPSNYLPSAFYDK